MGKQKRAAGISQFRCNCRLFGGCNSLTGPSKAREGWLHQTRCVRLVETRSGRGRVDLPLPWHVGQPERIEHDCKAGSGGHANNHSLVGCWSTLIHLSAGLGSAVMTVVNSPRLSPNAAAIRSTFVISAAAMISLAVAMGVGRFAFTPLFPLMVRDGLLTGEDGALLAASNYLGYLLGALVAARVRLKPATLLALGLIGIVGVTGAVGWTSSVPTWVLLRFLAGVLSAWALVATTAWGLGWLASLGRPHLAGAIFAGVGLGIAAAGVFCVLAAGPGISAGRMWTELAVLAGVATLFPLIVSRNYPTPIAHTQGGVSQALHREAPSGTGGLVVCYSVFGFGYILPATYLPALARQLVDDPQIFGWAWPVFGIAAALSTVVVSWGLRRFNRLHVWATSHLLMATGVLLPSVWASLTSIVMAALLVGGTFMVITMIGMQEARARAKENATVILARMTAGFAFGQLMGPVAFAALGRLTPDPSTALSYGLELAAVGLITSAMYLWHKVRHQNHVKEHCHG
jgi:MFS family permease